MIAFIGGVILGGILLSLSHLPVLFSPSSQPLFRFSSYEELIDFVGETPQYYYGYPEETWGATLQAGNTRADTSPSTKDFSTTNIQVEGVDEIDFVKSDGAYIYMVSNQTLHILKAYPPEEAGILAQIKLEKELHGIFISSDISTRAEDKLLVFGSGYHEISATEKVGPYYWPDAYETEILVYDITDRAEPTLSRNLTMRGYFYDARMIGNYVYAIINTPVSLNESGVDLPRIQTNGETQEIAATEIEYANITDYGYTYTTIVSVNIQDDLEDPLLKTLLLGNTRTIFVSLENIYIAMPGNYYPSFATEITSIYRIRVEPGRIECEANGDVKGYISAHIAQFSMDEYNDFFRIATTTGWGDNAKNHVFVLNMSLNVVGRLENLAPGETIYSARFMGETLYIVTFRKIDPLFIINLTDAEAPKVLGELKITGYSDYLHMYDTGYLIGVGKETIGAEFGNFAWYQGIKISLFNVTDQSNPQELDKTEIGDRGTDSPVLRDHHAFLFDRERNLLVLPVKVAEIDPEQYPYGITDSTQGEYVWQGAYIYSISIEHGLELRGRITHIENITEVPGSFYSSPYFIERSMFIEDILYTISEKRVMMNNIDSLAWIGGIDL
jgi:uncharacterized secreted protein with C-terminal beta-propeller domain